jgi:SAM-dependent methyltransferase
VTKLPRISGGTFQKIVRQFLTAVIKSAMQFDRIARYYHWMELLLASGLMQRCRTAHIPQTRNCRHALLAGEGHGRFLEALLRANPQIRVTCVEWSANMIKHARRRLARRRLDLSRVTFRHANLLECELTGARFDLIATHFFLDCLRPAQVRRAVGLLAKSSAPNAIWLLSDFRVPETGWRRWRAVGILAALYLFFRLTAKLPAKWLTPPDNFLRAHGFQLQRRNLASFGLAHSDLWRRAAEPPPDVHAQPTR